MWALVSCLVLIVCGLPGMLLNMLTTLTTPDFMNSLSEAMFKMLAYFMELSPLGVMSLMAYSVAQYGAGIFGALAKYIFCCWLCCVAVFFIVMVLPTCLYTKVPVGKYLKACGKIALVTLSTTSSAATLPHREVL